MYMVDSLGLDVKRVHAPGEDHLWNEVKIDGTLYLLEINPQ